MRKNVLFALFLICFSAQSVALPTIFEIEGLEPQFLVISNPDETVIPESVEAYGRNGENLVAVRKTAIKNEFSQTLITLKKGSKPAYLDFQYDTIKGVFYTRYQDKEVLGSFLVKEKTKDNSEVPILVPVSRDIIKEKAPHLFLVKEDQNSTVLNRGEAPSPNVEMPTMSNPSVPTPKKEENSGAQGLIVAPSEAVVENKLPKQVLNPVYKMPVPISIDPSTSSGLIEKDSKSDSGGIENPIINSNQPTIEVEQELKEIEKQEIVSPLSEDKKQDDGNKNLSSITEEKEAALVSDEDEKDQVETDFFKDNEKSHDSLKPIAIEPVPSQKPKNADSFSVEAEETSLSSNPVEAIKQNFGLIADFSSNTEAVESQQQLDHTSSSHEDNASQVVTADQKVVEETQIQNSDNEIVKSPVDMGGLEEIKDPLVSVKVESGYVVSIGEQDKQVLVSDAPVPFSIDKEPALDSHAQELMIEELRSRINPTSSDEQIMVIFDNRSK